MKVVILGAGDVGLHFIQFCEQENIDFAVIDRQKHLLEPLSKRGILVFCEDFQNTSFLNKKFFKDTELFFAVTNSDETNLIACKLASEFGVEHTVCRNQYLELREARESLETEYGNYRIVNPSKLLAREIVRNIQTPNSVDQFFFFDNYLTLIGFNVLPSCYLQNQSLCSFAKQFYKESIVPVGIQRKHEFYNFQSTLVPKLGDVIYFFCFKNNIKKLRKILGYHRERKQNIVIAGGGQNCYNLIHALNDSNFRLNIKVVDEDTQQCQHLVENFDNIMVLNFSILDKQSLVSDGIEGADIFVAAGVDTAKNITSCFLASELSIKNLICSVDYSFYQNIFHYFVFNNIRTVCSHLLTARFLSHLLYSKKILKYCTIQNSLVEFLELSVDYPLLQGHKFTDFILPSSVSIMAFYRNKKVFLQVRNYKFQLGDTILLCLATKDREATLKQLKFN